MEKEQRILISRIAAGALMLCAAYFIPCKSEYIKLIMFILPYITAGYDVIFDAISGIFKGNLLDEHFLMTVATAGAFCIGEYPEAVFVMLFYQVGELFGDIAKDRSRRSISTAMDIRPDAAYVKKGEAFVKVSPEDVNPGDIIEIKSGEKIPLDGMITDGASHMNTSAVTGESMPRECKKGDTVISGCINCEGLLHVKVTGKYSESTAVRILKLIEEAGENKSRSENFITRFSRIYTPFVLVCALLLALIPTLIFGYSNGVWIYRALIFLVVSCPCALVVSVPLTFFCGIGAASKDGILVKGSNYLEALADAKIFVFDKTGTLTRGSFEVSAVHPDEISKDELLAYAAAAEKYSNHPIAASICGGCKDAYDKMTVSDVRELPGMGICANAGGKQILVGNSALMESFGIAFRTCHKSGTLIHVAADGRYLGHIVISDSIKEDSKETVAALHDMGAKTVILTGDADAEGKRVAEYLGADEVHTELLPDGKVGYVDEMVKKKAKNEKLVFIGDGVNDAPSIRRADVGVAMGALGSDAATEAADIVITDDRPIKICKALKNAKRTRAIAKQNIALTLFAKGAVLILSAFGYAMMWSAVFADIGVLIIAVLNAIRAYKVQ